MPQKKKHNIEIPEDVTSRSTKTEILDAYQKLISQLETIHVSEEEEEIESEKQRVDLTEKYKDTPVDSILKQLADVKLTTNRAISEMTEKLIEKHQQLTELSKTIGLEEQYLKDIEKIKITVKSLKQLIRLQEQQKEIFEKEMEDHKNSWEEEKRRHERERQLEEEEYQFQIKRTRREEEETYRFKRQEKEKELKEHEEEIKQAKDELKELRELKEAYPKEMERAVLDAKKAGKAEAEHEASIRTQLLEKQVEGEKRLASSQIANLQESVKHKEDRIRQLELQLAQANDRIKDIAAGAVSIHTQAIREKPRDDEDRSKK